MKTSKVKWAVFASFMVFCFATAQGASVSGSNTGNVTIPDAGGYVSSTIAISGAPAGAVVTGIDVYFKCTHPYSGDLTVDLNADSTGSLGNDRLWNREGGAADNPTRTTTGITTFNGLSVNRTWYLYAKDWAAGDSGYIDEWTITIYYSTPANPPSISGVTPNPITADAGNAYQTVTINGANFVNKPTLILTWTGQSGYTLPASQVTFVNNSQLTMSIHLGAAADNWTVKAVNPDSQSSSAVGFVVNAPTPAPSISGVTPNPITADAGNAYQTVTINGANFVNKPTLILTWTGQSGYTLPASQVTFVNNSQLTMSIHLGAAADNWTVKAVNPDSQSSSAVGFVVDAPTPAPSISGVTPNPITADAGNAYQTLTINGANFVNKPTLILTWTGQSGYTLPASQVTFVNNSQLTMSIHLGAAADNWTVKAVNPDSQSSSAVGFVVKSPATQPILTVSPAIPPIQASVAGSIGFNVINTGSGPMSYTTVVTSGSSWLSIISGGSGGNSGTIGVSYTANSGPQRTGTIVVTAAGASGSPLTLTINQSSTGGNTVMLPGPIAYIRQITISDMHPNFNSANACGPCSAVMLLTYYNQLPPHPMIGKSGQNNDYSWYVAPIDQSGIPSSTAYSSEGFVFNIGTPDNYPGPVNYGAFGYLTQDFQTNPQTRADRAVQYFWKHGMWATFENAGTESKVRSEIDGGRPVLLSAQFSTGGHIMVIRGYDTSHLIAADPWIRSDNLDRHAYAYTWDELHYANTPKWIISGLSPIADATRVHATSGFNVREQPTISANPVSPMRVAGELGSVVLDASKNSTFWNADGYTWIKVRWDSDQALGWSVVGNGSSQWIEPINIAPTKIVALNGPLTFGNVTDGTTSQLILHLANGGNSPLIVSSIDYPPGFSGDWSSGTVAPGHSVDIHVMFAPISPVEYGGSITIHSDATSGANSLVASGTGVSTQPITYAVTPSSSANGSIDPNTLQTVNSSGAVSFTALPMTGFTVDKWLVNDVVAQSTSQVLTLTDVTVPTSIQVVFKPLPTVQQLTGLVIQDNIVQFALKGLAGNNYIIQSSSNLTDWSPLSTNTIPASGSVTVLDSIPVGQTGRFYRAVLVSIPIP